MRADALLGTSGMALYPLFADLAGREVLVVGGGEVAAREIAALLKADALVRLHAHAVLHPDIDAEAEIYAAAHQAWMVVTGRPDTDPYPARNEDAELRGDDWNFDDDDEVRRRLPRLAAIWLASSNGGCGRSGARYRGAVERRAGVLGALCWLFRTSMICARVLPATTRGR